MKKLIRNIPDETVNALKEQAKAKGLTLEAYIRLIIIEVGSKGSAHNG